MQEAIMLMPEIRRISDTIELHVFDFKILTDEMINLINKSIVSICEGNSDSSIEQVKQSFLNFLETKDDRTKIGAVAEFFVHLYLKQSGFKQEFLFFNLEERSIKKGFDGFFSKENQEYLVESKSGMDTTLNISHRSKLKEAYDDITSVIAGDSRKSKNNPWRNAYNHASHIDVGTSKSIRNKIKALSDCFDSGKYKFVGEFNVIPCSSIFVSGEWTKQHSNLILSIDDSFFKSFSAKSIKAICITKASYSSFLNYLRK